MSNLSIVMKNIRNKKGISGSKLASAMGMSPAYLTLIEKGERAVPVSFFPKLREFLGLTQEEQQDILQAINAHPLMTGDSLKKERVQEYWKQTLKIVNEIFTKIISSEFIDSEKINKLVELLQNLRDKLFGDYEVSMI